MAKYKAYPEYKDSGVEWLGGIPSHWTHVPCRSVVNHIVEKNETGHIKNYLSLMANIGVIPYEEKGDIGNKKPDDLRKCKIVKKGQLVINSMNYVLGSYGLSSYNGICSSVYIILGIKNNYLNDFAFRIFENNIFQRYLSSFGNGILAHRAAISWDDIKWQYVPMPQLAEQKKITNFIKNECKLLDELLNKQRQLIELLKEKRQAVISHAVTKGLKPDVPMKNSGVEWLGYMPSHWHVSKIKWIICLKSGESITSNEIVSDGNYPVYGGNGLRGFYKEYTHDGNYVIIGRQGAHCGNVQYANNKFWASEHAIVATPTFKYKIAWLGELFRAMNLNQYSVSAAQPGLAVENISDLKIPLPPYPEQKKLAKYIENHISINDKLIKNCLKCIKLLKERRTALISAAVTGKIDLRDWAPPASSAEAVLTAEEATA